MASRIIKDEFETGGDYKITVQFTNYRDYKKTCDFINGLNCDYAIGTEPAKLKTEQPEIKKPQGMLYILKGESMLDVANNVVNAVRFTVESPTGLAAISFDRESEIKNRLQELTDYLRTYANWR